MLKVCRVHLRYILGLISQLTLTSLKLSQPQSNSDLKKIIMILKLIRFRGDGQSINKSLRAEFLHIFAYCPIIKTNLFGDIKDAMLAFEFIHDLFDGTIEVPVLAPVYP